MAKAAPAKPRKVPATPKKPAAAPFPQSNENWTVTDLRNATPAQRKKHEKELIEKMAPAVKPAGKNWRVAATTPDHVAEQIAAGLSAKLANVAGAKAKKAAVIHKDAETSTPKAPKVTSKRGSSTKTAATTVKSKAKSPRKPAEKPPAQPVGRPSLYTQAIADAICERLSKGEPLASICRDDNMPAVRTVSDWKQANHEFSASIARVREEGFDAIAADCMKIADDGSNDTYVDSEGMVKTDYDIVQRSKLRIETRLKLLAKWDPKRYGDKMDVNHGGQEGNPIDVRTKVVMVPPKQTAEVFTRPFKAEEN